MVIELRQSLALAQQLIMTPQLQQAIKLLQLSRLELLDTIRQEMETNPILEEQVTDEDEGELDVEDARDETEQDIPDVQEVTVEERARDDVDWENYLSEYSTSRADELPQEVKEAPSLENITAARTNLYSHLMWQLEMGNFDEDQRKIGVHIIGNLDEDGYLDIPLEEVSAVTGCPLEKVVETLSLIQVFDPVGVAARDIREALLIQARFQNLEGTVVERIIMDHLGELEDKAYDHIANSLSVSVREVFGAVSVIQGLDPKPGRNYTDEETIYITPDIYVIKVGDDYEIIQNEDGMPKLRVNAYYRDLLRNRDATPENVRAYIQEKLRSASWLIKSIQQRQRTIYRATESIVRFQRNFFDKGITELKPLVLRDVAEDIEMHESTISRVTTHKYVHTPQGLFELKFFFNSSINGLDGDAVASESVKEQIRRLVKSENKTRPYSDKEIAAVLRELNIAVARRTVGKYRESMGILPSRKRKAFSRP